MGEIVELRARLAAGDCGPPRIDPLTAEVATVIWRLGGRASLAQIADALSLIRGRRNGLSVAERSALSGDIIESMVMRSLAGRPAIIQQSTEAPDSFALTDLAHRVLGARPAGHAEYEAELQRIRSVGTMGLENEPGQSEPD